MVNSVPEAWGVGMGLLGRVKALWYWQRRRDDLRFLWPALLDSATSGASGTASGASGITNLDEARAAFALHAYDSPAWLCLSPEDLSYRLHNLEDTRLPKYVVAPADELVKPADAPHHR
jgi:hypothetical protein